MTRLKMRHVTEAARPQGKIVVVALLISLVWIFFASGERPLPDRPNPTSIYVHGSPKISGYFGG